MHNPNTNNSDQPINIQEAIEEEDDMTNTFKDGAQSRGGSKYFPDN